MFKKVWESCIRFELELFKLGANLVRSSQLYLLFLYLEVCELTRRHARIAHPSFSPLGVIYYLRSLLFPMRVHSKVLVYQSSTSPLVFHAYLLPEDARLKELVERDEEKLGGELSLMWRARLEIKRWKKRWGWNCRWKNERGERGIELRDRESKRGERMGQNWVMFWENPCLWCFLKTLLNRYALR